MIIALLATQEISFAAFAFPAYVFIMNLIIISLALRQYHKKQHTRKKYCHGRQQLSIGDYLSKNVTVFPESLFLCDSNPNRVSSFSDAGNAVVVSVP